MYFPAHSEQRRRSFDRQLRLRGITGEGHTEQRGGLQRIILVQRGKRELPGHGEPISAGDGGHIVVEEDPELFYELHQIFREEKILRNILVDSQAHRHNRHFQLDSPRAIESQIGVPPRQGVAGGSAVRAVQVDVQKQVD